LSKKGDSIHESTAFRSKQVRGTFEKIAAILGWSFTESLIFDLENYCGLPLYNDDSVCTLAQIRDGLEELLDKDAADSIMDRIKKILVEELRSLID